MPGSARRPVASCWSDCSRRSARLLCDDASSTFMAYCPVAVSPAVSVDSSSPPVA
jgi:hypothetical protein